MRLRHLAACAAAFSMLAACEPDPDPGAPPPPADPGLEAAATSGPSVPVATDTTAPALDPVPLPPPESVMPDSGR